MTTTFLPSIIPHSYAFFSTAPNTERRLTDWCPVNGNLRRLATAVNGIINVRRGPGCFSGIQVQVRNTTVKDWQTAKRAIAGRPIQVGLALHNFNMADEQFRSFRNVATQAEVRKAPGFDKFQSFLDEVSDEYLVQKRVLVERISASIDEAVKRSLTGNDAEDDLMTEA